MKTVIEIILVLVATSVALRLLLPYRDHQATKHKTWISLLVWLLTINLFVLTVMLTACR